MREIRAIRKGVNAGSSAVGAIVVPVALIGLAPTWLALAGVAVVVALVILAGVALYDARQARRRRPAPFRISDHPAAQNYRRRMAELGHHVR